MPISTTHHSFIATVKYIFLALVLTASGQAFAQESTPLISVNGQGKVSAQPDQANVALQFSESSMDASKARQVVDKEVEKLLRKLKNYTIKENSLDSSQTQIHPQYDYHQNRSELKGYQVQRSVSFILSDLSEIEALVETISESKDARLQPLQFGVSKPAQLQNKALNKAIKQSKATAQKIAESYGVTLGKIHSVNYQSSRSNRPVLRAMSMDIASAESAPTYKQKDLDFTANIQVSFTFE